MSEYPGNMLSSLDDAISKVRKTEPSAIVISMPLSINDFSNINGLSIATDRMKAMNMKHFIKGLVELVSWNSLLFIVDREFFLAQYDEVLASSSKMTFKYMIEVQIEPVNRNDGIPVSHFGVSVYSNNGFPIERVLVPHRYCQFCGENVKDWGGKKHLLNPEGSQMSDVWKHLNISHDDVTSGQYLETIVKEIRKLLGDSKSLEVFRLSQETAANETTVHESYASEQSRLFDYCEGKEVKSFIESGDCVESMRKLPSNCVNMFFADPPYNLLKDYASYSDDKKAHKYLTWTESWLEEAIRLLNPNGSMFILNIPKWSVKHARYLSEKGLFLVDWVVWDESGGPRGKLLPSHYALLWFSKTRNYKFMDSAKELRMASNSFCSRSSCRRKRNKAGVDDTIPLTDLWSDVHRIKHRNRKVRGHPCQLPEMLVERLIRLTTERNDLVLDPFVGTGTTTAVANRLKRRYVGIDIDKYYVDIAKRRLRLSDEKELHLLFDDVHEKISDSVFFESSKKTLTKKYIQETLKELAIHIGRLPKPEDLASSNLEFTKEEVLSKFENWKDAIYAAKIYFKNKNEN